MPGPLVLVGPALATAGRYIVKNGAKKGIEKYGPKVFKQIQKDKGLKTVGDKVIKKRMTAAERKAMSKDFNKSLADAQKAKKGPTNKEFMARVDKDMAKQKRIDKVKAENMAAAKRKPLYGGGGTKKSMRMPYKTGGEVMPKAKPC
tara:strand:- start:21 stop:458 length:438 start_codon:yes stop_codon:yes gene_type:complete